MLCTPMRWRTVLLTMLAALIAQPALTETTLNVKGSDTIGGALGPALARAYERAQPEIRVAWESLGSGTAFVGLFDGSADLGASSRSIKSSELDEAQKLGIRLKEYVLGYDGIAVLVHPSNPVPSLTLEQLAAIFRGQILRWSAVGGPDRPIRLISRPSYSGTHGFFKKAVLRRTDDQAEFAEQTRFVEHSEDIAREVAGQPDAISFLGMGWQRDDLRTVPIATAEGSPPVAPSTATVRDGSYPIYRPLLLYTRGEPRGELRRFVAFLFSPPSQRIVSEQGFIPSDTPSQVASRLPSLQAEAGDQVDVTRVWFPSGGWRLNDRARATLDGLTGRLRADAVGTVLIIGHADATGGAEVNRRVALARARAVAEYLTTRGVDPALLALEAAGEDQPIATNETVQGRRQNRRVDIRLLAGR